LEEKEPDALEMAEKEDEERKAQTSEEVGFSTHITKSFIKRS